MNNFNFCLCLIIIMLLAACSTVETEDIEINKSGGAFSADYSLSSGSGGSVTVIGHQGAESSESGLLTAGEWNDLDNWAFWQDLILKKDFADMPDYWGFYPARKVSVLIKNGSRPLIDARVELRYLGRTVWSTRSDNKGSAELWIDLMQERSGIKTSNLQLFVNGDRVSMGLNLAVEEVKEIQVAAQGAESKVVELAFIVDATGSMADELEFLKQDLENVINRVEQQDQSLEISTAAVFYRDESDEYLVRPNGFTQNLSQTVSFIRQQQADGGGDFPEAVHSALTTAVNDLQWSDQARTRIAFLLLDAPPHYEGAVIDEIHESVRIAAEKGIKIIPVSASGIDKETEFLLRFFSIATNGTYVFITDHSGIGNDHLEPSIGEYEVEYLNDLMVRLINFYSE